MKSSFLETLSAALSKRTNKGHAAGKTGYRPHTPAKRQRGFRLGLEALEDRLVPASLLVTSPLDFLNTPGTLRDAVNQANLDGVQGIADSISFASSLTGAHILLQLGNLELTAGASVSIWGSGIILNGDSDNIFQVDSGASLGLREVTLAGGTAVNGNGGGINNAGTLSLYGCTLTGNSATGGANSDSGLGPLGGAIYNTGTLVTSYPNTFTDNSAWSGGAVANGPGGIASLENDSYSGNSAAVWGGAIFNSAALTVYDCNLSGNKAEFGGGLVNYRGTVTLNSATLAGNTATGPSWGSGAGQGGGGAIENGGAMTLTATTVSGNSGYRGGGIDCEDLGNGDSLTLVDSIVAGNTWFVPGNLPANPTAPFYPDFCNAAVTADSAYNLIGDGTGLSGISNGSNGNQIGSSKAPINPLLTPLANNGGPAETMAPLSGSPALAAGGPVTTLTKGISAQDTLLHVADAAVFESTALTMGFEINGELMWVQSVDLVNNTVTVGPRSKFPWYTAPGNHDAGADLYLLSNPLGVRPSSTAPSLGAVQPSALIVTTASDPANPTAGTLRSAVNQANTDAAQGMSDTIIFATAPMGSSIITLQQGDLELRAGVGTTTIDGGGRVSVSGGGKSGVFVVDSGAQAVLTGLTIDKGVALSGAGIDNSGTLSVSNTTISGNNATSPSLETNGGGIYNAGTLNLIDVTVANNNAGNDSQGANGGGIYNAGTLNLTDVTVANNKAQSALSQGGNGGGIYNNGTLTLTATTVSGNVADNRGADGGGIANFATLTLVDTIVAGNTCQNAGTDPDMFGSVVASSAYNLVGIGTGRLSGISNGVNHNQVGTSSAPIQALLARLGHYGGTPPTMALLPGSPAVGAGEPIAGITTDERGQPVASPPSIGAFQNAEVASLQVSAVTTATADTPLGMVITARDASGQAVADATFPVTLTSSDGHTVLPAIVTLTNGIWSGAVTLHYPGTVTLTARAGLAKGPSNAIVVSPAAPVSFTLINPATAPSWAETAGVGFPVIVNAVDAGGQAPIGYSGPVTLAVTGNAQPVLGLKNNSLTMKDGTWTGTITLDKEADLTLTASAGSVTGKSDIIFVGPLKANHLSVTAASFVTAGVPFPLTIKALDKYNNLATWPFINGRTVRIVCSGGQTVYQGKPTFTYGTDTVPVTLDKAGGPFTLTVTTGNLMGICSVSVDPGLVASFVVTSSKSSVLVGRPETITVTAVDTGGNRTIFTGTVTLSTDDGSDVISFDHAHAFQGATIQMNNSTTGSVTVLLEGVGNRKVIASAWSYSGSSLASPITGTTKTAIRVNPDWYSAHIPDPGMQLRAREDYIYGGGHITYDGLLDLFTQAEKEVLGTSTTAALSSLQVLVNNASDSNVTMASYLQNLATEVLKPSAGDVSFLAYYYSFLANGAGISVVMINGQPAFGDGSGSDGARYASQTTALVNQWLLGSVHPIDAIGGPPGGGDAYSTPTGPLNLFGLSGVPAATDVQQGTVGDCWLVVALAEVAYRDPTVIHNMFIPHDNGTYTVRIYGGSPLTAEYVTVDNQLPNGGSDFASPYVGGTTVLWAALAEKAFAESYGPGASKYSYEYLDGLSPNPRSGFPSFSLEAITGLATDQNAGFGGNGQPKWQDVTNNLNNGKFVCLGTPQPENSPVLESAHAYAVLSYDPGSGNFLLYNPWGIGAVTALNGGVSDATTTTISVNNANVIGPLDLIQIDSELMLVKSVDLASNTLTVLRGYDGTTASAHGDQTGVFLNMSRLSPGHPPVYGSWTQFNNVSILSRSTNPPGIYGLFVVSGSFMNQNFDELDNTHAANVRTPGGAAAAAPTVSTSTLGPTAANAASGSTSSPGASPSGGNVVGLCFAQAAPLTQPQWGPAPAAASLTPVNRLTKLEGKKSVSVPRGPKFSSHPPERKPRGAGHGRRE